MRKSIIALLAVMAIGVGLVGCEKAEETPVKEDSNTPSVETPVGD